MSDLTTEQKGVLATDGTELRPGTDGTTDYLKQQKLAKFLGISLADLATPLPEAENPDALLAGNFMRKGHAVFLSAPSGVGKSVVSLQLAYAWARGEEVLGLKPVRPLHIAIIESEDDHEEMWGFRESMRRGFKMAHGWTDEDIAAAEHNFTWLKDAAAISGEGFVNFIAEAQDALHEAGLPPYDLFIVNPFLNYIGVDATNNDELKAILRNQLDPVIKGEIAGKPWTKCGVFFIHHFTKPPSAQARGTFGIDEYAHYAALGGSDLTNWQRATLTLAPITKDLDAEGNKYFWLAAPKRGKRLPWPKNILKEAPSIPARLLRQGNWHRPEENGLTFWFDVPIGQGPNALPGSGGDAQATGSTVEADAAWLAEAVRLRMYGATELRNLAESRWQKPSGAHDKQRGTAAYEHLLGHIAQYGLGIKCGKRNAKTIGTLEDLERLVT